MSTMPHDTLEYRLGELTAQLGACDHALAKCSTEKRRLAEQLGAARAELAAVAQQRDALKRLVDEADALRNRQLAAIDSIKHGGLRILLALAHDVRDLERLLDAGDRNTEAADAAQDILATSDDYEAERRVRKWITG